MNKYFKKISFILISCLLFLTSCFDSNNTSTEVKNKISTEQQKEQVLKGEAYSSKDDVALYIYLFKELPANFITKKEAQNLGWDSKKGNLWDVAPGKSIGGDIFRNREKKLPTKDKVTWYECDINYNGGYRSDERIVYSTKGIVYYTGDHYNSFKLLYPKK